MDYYRDLQAKVITIIVALNGGRPKFAYKAKREELRYYIVDDKERAENM